MHIRTVVIVILMCGGGGGGETRRGGGREERGRGRGGVFDFNYKTILRGPEKASEFGFSITVWKGKVVVGAPKSTGSLLAGGSTHLGAIHLCDVTNNTCPVFPHLPDVVNRDEDILKYTGPLVLKNGTMGFGETVYSNSILLSCAPRYPVLDSLTQSLQGRGACYILTDPSSSIFKEIFPFTEQTFKHHVTENGTNTIKLANNSDDFTAYASFGFSVTSDSRGSRYFIGAPNAFKGQGVMLYSSKRGTGVTKQKNDLSIDNSTDGRLEGWAAAAGRFGKGEAVAVSRPGYGDLSVPRGQIIFFDTKLSGNKKAYMALEGHFAGWFGYSLAACKVDEDTYSDLVVGAPLDSRDPRLYPDAGVVYLYYAPLLRRAPRESPVKLLGEVPWGRFGTSVACAGDLNADSYEDVAIGAPGAGGRVYIYKGGRDGLHTTPMQIIHATDFFPPTATFGFGFSLSGGADMDDNTLPDLLIGSPAHDAVVLLRTSPLVHLEANVTFEPETVTLSNRSCQVEKAKVICTDLLVTITYKGKRNHGELAVDLELSVDEELNRLSFYDEEQRVWRQRLSIRGHKISGRDRMDEMLRVKVYGKAHRIVNNNSVAATVKASLTKPPHSSSSSPLPPPPPPPPLLDTTFPNMFFSSPNLTLTGADDSESHSQTNIVLDVNAPAHLVEGEDNLHLSVLITIFNDTAHSITFNLTFPSDLSFLGSNTSMEIPPLCVLKEENYNNDDEEEGDELRNVTSSLTCVFNYDVSPGEEIKLDLTFAVRQFTVSQSPANRDSLAPTTQPTPTLKPTPLVFLLSVNSKSTDINEEDNSVSVLVRRVSGVDLFPGGTSDPDRVDLRLDEHLRAEEMTEETKRRNISVVRLGPLITHRFALINNGPTSLHDFQVEVKLPLKYKGDQLLYLIEAPVTHGPVTCHSGHLHLNPLGFALPNEDITQILQQLPRNITTEEEEEEKEEEETEMAIAEKRTRRRIKKRNVDLTLKTSTFYSPLPLLSDSAITPPFNSPSSSSSSSTSSSSSFSTVSSSSASTSNPSVTTSILTSNLSTVSPPPPPPLPSDSLANVTKDTERPKTIIIDSPQTDFEVVQCVGRKLTAGESAMIKVNVYLVASTVHHLAASVQKAQKEAKQQHGTTLAFHSTFTVHTRQRCVYVNGQAKGAHGDDCGDFAEVTATDEAQNDTDTTDGLHNATGTAYNLTSVSGTSSNLTSDPETSRNLTSDPGTSRNLTSDPETSRNLTSDPGTSIKLTNDPGTAEKLTNDPEMSNNFFNASGTANILFNTSGTPNNLSPTTGTANNLTDTREAHPNPQTTTQPPNSQSQTTTEQERPTEAAGGDSDDDGDDGDDRSDGDAVSFEVKVETRITLLTKPIGKAPTMKDLYGWKLILTIAGGVMLVVIIGSIMYKCGFFKREKRLTPEQRDEMKSSIRRRRERNKRKRRKKGGCTEERPERKFSHVMVM